MRKIKKLLVAAVAMTTLMSVSLSASKAECMLSQEGKVSVSWKAYKTATKIGVGGVFDNVAYTAVKAKGKSLKEILVDSTVTINTDSVNSKNKGRDVKLVNSFFNIMSNGKITVKIIDVTSKDDKTGTITMDVTMNGVTKKVPMKYNHDKNTLKGEGFIDIFDFGASKALSTLNQACFDKHKGKTWSDVAIGFEMQVSCN